MYKKKYIVLYLDLGYYFWNVNPLNSVDLQEVETELINLTRRDTPSTLQN